MRNRDWLTHAIETIQKIKDLKQCSPLGYYNSPEEYMQTIEDFTKLIFGLNGVSDEAIIQFNKTANSFELYKSNLFKYCDILLTEYERMRDEE